MKICVFNVKKNTRDAIDGILNSIKIYSSRSELIRCAIREYILFLGKKEESENQNSDIIHIPSEKADNEGNLITTYIRYKVVKRLESTP